MISHGWKITPGSIFIVKKWPPGQLSVESIILEDSPNIKIVVKNIKYEMNLWNTNLKQIGFFLQTHVKCMNEIRNLQSRSQ